MFDVRGLDLARTVDVNSMQHVPSMFASRLAVVATRQLRGH
jgi:hypothetical protein